MIGRIQGTIVDWFPSGELIVDVHGVGYRITVPATALGTLGDLRGDEVVLHTHLHVREDAMVLYGFPTREERISFEALLGAHGVGPSLALAILSALRPDDLRRALAEGDADALCAVPGVGKKTAARLLIELRSRLDLPDLDLAESTPGTSGARQTVRDALTELGYGPEEIREALADLPAGDDAEAMLRDALRRLAVSP